MSIDRSIELASPTLFQFCASGTPFQRVDLYLTAARESGRPFTYVLYTFKLIAVKTIVYSPENRDTKETVSFEYGGLQINYRAQNPDGTSGATAIAGWDRVRNVREISDDPIR